MNSCRLLSSLIIAISLLTTCSAHSIPVTSPSSLNPGDPYRLAFVTFSDRNAASSNIAVYNSFVQSQADATTHLVSLGATWKAIASTPSIDARDNTDTNPNVEAGVPIFLLNDTKLVDDNADLWDGSLDLFLNITENANEKPGSPITVWTGTLPDGTSLGNGALGGSDALVGTGSFQFDNSGWINAASGDKELLLPMYAISSVLTAVPEPTTSGLVLTAVFIFGVFRRRN